MNKFEYFEGNENEKEFLEKCLAQWDKSSDKEPIFAMIEIATVFAEMRHRVEELSEEK